MTHESYFLVALGVTVGVSALVAIYLRWPLRRVLIELCGTAERAAFWNVCCDIVLILLPIAALLIGRVTDRYSDASPFFAVVDQLRAPLFGLLLAVLFIALAVAIQIGSGGAKATVAVNPTQIDELQRLLAKVDSIRAREIVSRSEN